MEFTEMRDKLMEHFNEMVKDVDHVGLETKGAICRKLRMN